METGRGRVAMVGPVHVALVLVDKKSGTLPLPFLPLPIGTAHRCRSAGLRDSCLWQPVHVPRSGVRPPPSAKPPTLPSPAPAAPRR